MSKVWKPWNMSRCDCETKKHSGFCILSPSYRGVDYSKIGRLRPPVNETLEEME